MTTTPSRRAVLAGTATALAAGSVVNLAALAIAKADTRRQLGDDSASDKLSFADPIFSAIERHRAAELRKLAAGAAYAVMSPTDPNYAAVQAADDAARDEQELAGAALLETKPTTRAGVSALIAYVLAFNAGAVSLPGHPEWCSSACDWPETTDEDGIDVTGFVFLKHVADAIDAIERKAVAS